jgi:hypothetical protein
MKKCKTCGGVGDFFRTDDLCEPCARQDLLHRLSFGLSGEAKHDPNNKDCHMNTCRLPDRHDPEVDCDCGAYEKSQPHDEVASIMKDYGETFTALKEHDEKEVCPLDYKNVKEGEILTCICPSGEKDIYQCKKTHHNGWYPCKDCVQVPMVDEKEGWEAEFDRRTNPDNYKVGAYHTLIGEDMLLDPSYYPESAYELDAESIKSFIRTLLAKAYEEGQQNPKVGFLRQSLRHR